MCNYFLIKKNSVTSWNLNYCTHRLLGLSLHDHAFSIKHDLFFFNCMSHSTCTRTPQTSLGTWSNHIAKWGLKEEIVTTIYCNCRLGYTYNALKALCFRVKQSFFYLQLSLQAISFTFWLHETSLVLSALKPCTQTHMNIHTHAYTHTQKCAQIYLVKVQIRTKFPNIFKNLFHF